MSIYRPLIHWYNWIIYEIYHIIFICNHYFDLRPLEIVVDIGSNYEAYIIQQESFVNVWSWSVVLYAYVNMSVQYEHIMCLSVFKYTDGRLEASNLISEWKWRGPFTYLFAIRQIRQTNVMHYWSEPLHQLTIFIWSIYNTYIYMCIFCELCTIVCI